MEPDAWEFKVYLCNECQKHFTKVNVSIYVNLVPNFDSVSKCYDHDGMGYVGMNSRSIMESYLKIQLKGLTRMIRAFVDGGSSINLCLLYTSPSPRDPL